MKTCCTFIYICILGFLFLSLSPFKEKKKKKETFFDNNVTSSRPDRTSAVFLRPGVPSYVYILYTTNYKSLSLSPSYISIANNNICIYKK